MVLLELNCKNLLQGERFIFDWKFQLILKILRFNKLNTISPILLMLRKILS